MSNPNPLDVASSHQDGAQDPGLRADHLVLYDGTCGLCDRVIQQLLRRDHRRTFRYAPLQGVTAAALRAQFPGQIPDGLETVVYIDRSHTTPRIWTRSQAAVKILETLGERTLSAALLRAIPRPLADLLYQGVAKIRYRIFGRVDHCDIPDPRDRALFLD